VLDRYSNGPSVYLSEALREPTARAVVERVLHGVVDLLTYPPTPTTCMWVHGALSCWDDPLRKEFAAQRVAGFEELRARFRRAVTEGDLPINADAATLADFVLTVNFGLTVQASTGATRKDLLCVVAAALQALAEVKLRQRNAQSSRAQLFCCPHFLPAVAVSTRNYQQLLAPPVPRSRCND
jgi:hypothetical protein